MINTAAHARSTDPETSHDAADSVRNIRASQIAVLALFMAGPATDEQLAERAKARRLRISPSGLRSRRSELVRMGMVVDTGERERTYSNRRTIVWAASPDAE
jgi:hypothetical protein